MYPSFLPPVIFVSLMDLFFVIFDVIILLIYVFFSSWSVGFFHEFLKFFSLR